MPASLARLSRDTLARAVVRVAQAQQRLWDAVMCGGFDYRAVEGEVNQGANMWYTKTPGSPDILLHYNYYEVRSAAAARPAREASAALGSVGWRVWRVCACACMCMCMWLGHHACVARGAWRGVRPRDAVPPVPRGPSLRSRVRARAPRPPHLPTGRAQPPLGTKPRGQMRAVGTQEQPPPMAVLCMADAIFQALREHSLGRTVVAEGASDDDDDDDDADVRAPPPPRKEPLHDAPAWALRHGLVPQPRAAERPPQPAATVGPPSSAVPCPAAEGGAPSGEPAAQAEGPASGAGARAGADAAVEGSGSSAGARREAGGKRRRPLLKKVKEHREIGIDEDPLVALVRQAEEDSRRLLWPRRPNFRSVLAIGYRGSDSFKWHTDLAGDEGWVCSISVGAKAIFEYLPTAAPSALRRARAKAAEECVRVEIDSGDAVLFNGGLVPHRVASVSAAEGPGASPSLQAMMAPYVRLNLQVRIPGYR